MCNLFRIQPTLYLQWFLRSSCTMYIILYWAQCICLNIFLLSSNFVCWNDVYSDIVIGYSNILLLKVTIWPHSQNDLSSIPNQYKCYKVCQCPGFILIILVRCRLCVYNIFFLFWFNTIHTFIKIVKYSRNYRYKYSVTDCKHFIIQTFLHISLKIWCSKFKIFKDLYTYHYESNIKLSVKYIKVFTSSGDYFVNALILKIIVFVNENQIT